MQTLYKEVSDLIEDHDTLTFNSVAALIGSTKQEMSRFKSGGSLSFRKLLRMSYLLFPDNQQKVMSDWCLELSTTESIKQGFEYASITRNIPLLGLLISKHKDEKGTVGTCVSIYTILYKFYTNEIKASDLIAELSKIGQVKDELFILSEIIKCYNYFYLEKFHLMLETAHLAEKLTKELGDRHLFIKECYVHRISEILANVSLFLNDKEQARKYSDEIINADLCPKTVSDAYYILGMTYLVEDERKCLDYLQLRYEITKGIGEEDIMENARRDLDFTKLYLNVELAGDSDPVLIKLQENRGSEFELKLIKEEMYKQGDDDFLVLLGSMAYGSVEKLNQCRRKFLDNSNYLFASLAALELRKKGDSHALVQEAINFKHKTKGDVEFEKNYIRCFSDFNRIHRSITA